MSGFGHQLGHIHLPDTRPTPDPQIAATICEIPARIARHDGLTNPRGKLSLDFFQSISRH